MDEKNNTPNALGPNALGAGITPNTLPYQHPPNSATPFVQTPYSATSSAMPSPYKDRDEDPLTPTAQRNTGRTSGGMGMPGQQQRRRQVEDGEGGGGIEMQVGYAR